MVAPGPGFIPVEVTGAKEECDPLPCRVQATCAAGKELLEGLSHSLPFRPVFHSLRFALQVHVTFNVTLNLITISCKHFSPEGFPQKCLLVKGHFLIQYKQDFSGRQGCTHHLE